MVLRPRNPPILASSSRPTGAVENDWARQRLGDRCSCVSILAVLPRAACKSTATTNGNAIHPNLEWGETRSERKAVGVSMVD